MIKILFLFLAVTPLAFSRGITNYETVISNQKQDSIKMIESKEKEVLRAAEKYKEAIEDKRDAMLLLLIELKKIEALLKKNQLERKSIIHKWKTYLKSQKIILKESE